MDQSTPQQWDLLRAHDWGAVGRLAGGAFEPADQAPPPPRDTTALPVAEPTDGRLAFRALVAFTIVLIAAPQEFFPFLGPLRLALLSAIVAASAHLLGSSKDTPAQGMSTELKICLALVVWAALCVPYSYWPGGSIQSFMDRYSKTLIIFWLLGQVVSSVGRLRVMLWTIAAVTVPLAVTGVKNYLTGSFVLDRVVGYTGGMTANPNDLALTLNLFIPLTAALALTAARGWQRKLAWGIIGLNVGAVLVTFSRGGFLTLLAEGGLLMLVLIRRGAGKTVGGVLICAVLSLAVLPAGFGERMGTIFKPSEDTTGSAQNRWTDSVIATNYVIDHPLVGAGFDMNFLALNEARGNLWVRVHNTYLDYAVDLGLPGLVMFVALLTVSIRSARRIERTAIDIVGSELQTFASGIRVSLGGFLVAAFFHPVPYHFYFYYIAGLSVALKTTAARQLALSGRV